MGYASVALSTIEGQLVPMGSSQLDLIALSTASRRIPLDTAAELAREIFGIDGEPEPLPGERSQNFLIRSPERELIIRVSGPEDDLEAVGLQIAALEHIAGQDSALPVPRIIRSRGGQASVELNAALAGHVVYAQTVLPGLPTDVPKVVFFIGDVIGLASEFILQNPTMKVLNVSLSYYWMSSVGINPDENAFFRYMIRQHGLYAQILARLAEDNGIIIVSAAGNDSSPLKVRDFKAMWASPFNWAAMNAGVLADPAKNILVTEAVDRTGSRAHFSNVGGHISAPGVLILSTAAAGADSYAVMSGTSQAAHHISALVVELYVCTAAPSVSLRGRSDSRSWSLRARARRWANSLRKSASPRPTSPESSGSAFSLPRAMSRQAGSPW